MRSASFENSQNVLISQYAASLESRVLARIIDFAFILCYILIVVLLTSFVFDSVGYFGTKTSIYLLFILPSLLYSLVFESIMGGQTPGKRIKKIKVVKTDGSEASFSVFLIRWLFEILEVRLFAGVIAIIVVSSNKKGQRVGDIVAQSMVIDLKRRESLKKTIFEERELRSDLKYPEVYDLSEKDLQTVKDVIVYYEMNTVNEKALNMIKRTAKMIRNKYNIESSDVPYTFLSDLLKDYNIVNY